MVLGLRGIPGVQGGVETHAEHLYLKLADLGCRVEVIVRTPYVPPGATQFGSIRLRRIWSPTSAGLEALLHSLLGVCYAALARPDVLHIHAIGPAIVAPLARLAGLKVVMTHHGPDYDRDKWGGFARWLLRRGESLGVRFSHAQIAISRVIADLIASSYGRRAWMIPNGVPVVTLQTDTDAVVRLGLTPGRYMLQVGRMVPEKRQLDLIQAFRAAGLPGWKLALVGALDGSDYSDRVRAEASSPNIVLTGFQTGGPLQQIYSHAGFFVLPSSHEGLPIAMLEAMSYGLPVIASDIPANLEVGLPEESYFSLGGIPELAAAMKRQAEQPLLSWRRDAIRADVAARYDWGRIAGQTLDVYRALLKGSSAG